MVSARVLQLWVLACLASALPAGGGFWRTREELKKLQCTDEMFLPRGAPREGASSPCQEYIPVLQSWERALRRSMNWYSKP